jgi:hypothetical protein
MVSYKDTFHARLAAAAAPNARVYTFAASGAPLSQYLAWARDARMTWKAQTLVVVVIANDFDESLARYKTGPGFHHYVVNGDGTLELKRFDYRPALLRTVVEHSYLMKYLLFNVEAHHHLRGLIDLLPDVIRPARAEIFVGNTSADTGPERVAFSQAAVRAFLGDIVAYAAQLESSYFGVMRRFFMAEAREAGFHVLDLDPHFFARYRESPVLFEFRTDGHWNALAHGIVADAISAAPFFKEWSRRSAHGGSAGE